jgi:hypothetical protein
MKEWMKLHIEPASTVKDYMMKTVLNRAGWIRENSDSPICACCEKLWYKHSV